MKRIAWVGAILVMVAIGVGLLRPDWLGVRIDKGVLVPLDEVPTSLVNIAKTKLPEVSFDHARRLANGNYEIRGKTKSGKVREVETTAAGEIVEIE